MRSIPAGEIKLRGIGAVDEALKEGPVHIIKRDRPSYVVMREDHYQELVEARDEAYLASVRESMRDLEAGRTRAGSAEDLIREFGLET